MEGVRLWKALRKSLHTTYVGLGEVPELIHLVFRAPDSVEVDEFRQSLPDLREANIDLHLLHLALANQMAGKPGWLRMAVDTDLASGVPWRQQRAIKLQGFATGGTWPVDSFDKEPAANKPEVRRRWAAQARHRDAWARHWWRTYWETESDADAYAAWKLLLDCVDRKGEVWLREVMPPPSEQNRRRSIHVALNWRDLRSAMGKKHKDLEREFLGQRTVEGVGPWFQDQE